MKLPKRGLEDGDRAWRKKRRGRVFHHLIEWEDVWGDFKGFDFTCPERPSEEKEELEDGGEWKLLDEKLRCKTCSSILDAFDSKVYSLSEKTRGDNWHLSSKVVRSVTYPKRWDGLRHKFTLKLDREQYENLKNAPRFKTKKGAKAGRWRVKPRAWVNGEKRYRYWARKIGRTPNKVEYFPTEEEKKGKFRRGAKASGMSFQIKKEIFRLIQEGNSNHIDRLMKKYDYSLFDLFPKRGVNAPESRRMIERQENLENIDDDELLEFSKKIWKTALSHLIGLQLRDRFGDEDRGVKKSNHDWPEKQIQLYCPDFSVVVWELLFKSNEKKEVSLKGKIRAATVTMNFINKIRKKRGVKPYESVKEYLLERDPELLKEYRSEG